MEVISLGSLCGLNATQIDSTSDWSHESRWLQGILLSKYTQTPPPEDRMRSLRDKLNPGIVHNDQKCRVITTIQ